jgi:hypothetical protein
MAGWHGLYIPVSGAMRQAASSRAAEEPSSRAAERPSSRAAERPSSRAAEQPSSRGAMQQCRCALTTFGARAFSPPRGFPAAPCVRLDTCRSASLQSSVVAARRSPRVSLCSARGYRSCAPFAIGVRHPVVAARHSPPGLASLGPGLPVLCARSPLSPGLASLGPGLPVCAPSAVVATPLGRYARAPPQTSRDFDRFLSSSTALRR